MGSYARSYGQVMAALDADKVLCAGCSLVMEPSDDLDDMEGEPRCPACWQDMMDTRRDVKEGR